MQDRLQQLMAHQLAGSMHANRKHTYGRHEGEMVFASQMESASVKRSKKLRAVGRVATPVTKIELPAVVNEQTP